MAFGWRADEGGFVLGAENDEAEIGKFGGEAAVGGGVGGDGEGLGVYGAYALGGTGVAEGGTLVGDGDGDGLGGGGVGDGLGGFAPEVGACTAGWVGVGVGVVALAEVALEEAGEFDGDGLAFVALEGTGGGEELALGGGGIEVDLEGDVHSWVRTPSVKVAPGNWLRMAVAEVEDEPEALLRGAPVTVRGDGRGVVERALPTAPAPVLAMPPLDSRRVR